MEFLAAKCPNCSGDLRLPDNIETVKCMYCGVDVVVRKAVKAGEASIDNLLKIAGSAAQAGNNEEAYEYFTKALEFDPNCHIALLGKATAAGCLSTLTDFRGDELLQGIDAAVENSPDDSRELIRIQAAETILDVCQDHSPNPQYASLSRAELRSLCSFRSSIIECLKAANKHDPTNIYVIQTLVFECRLLALDWKQVGIAYDREMLRAGALPDTNHPKSMDGYVQQYKDQEKEWLSKLEMVDPDSYAKILELDREPVKTNPSSGCATMLISAGTVITILIGAFQ